MQPVVHVEIIGANPARLREFYGALFGWRFDVGDASNPAISDPGQYGFVTGLAPTGPTSVGSSTVHGGVGGGRGHAARALFYIAVDDVGAALSRAEELGGRRVLGPLPGDRGGPVVGHLADPEGTVVGVAGPR